MTKPLTAVALPLLMTMMLSQAIANPTNPAKANAESDRYQICQTLTYFFEGANMGSVSAVESACHPKASFTMLNTQTGHMDAHDVDAHLKAVKMGQLSGTQNLRLIDLDIDGNAALAKVKIDEEGKKNRSIRYLQLVRVGEQWRIVNETAYRKSS